jgi:hypothetical protein
VRLHSWNYPLNISKRFEKLSHQSLNLALGLSLSRLKTILLSSLITSVRRSYISQHPIIRESDKLVQEIKIYSLQLPPYFCWILCNFCSMRAAKPPTITISCDVSPLAHNTNWKEYLIFTFRRFFQKNPKV